MARIIAFAGDGGENAENDSCEKSECPVAARGLLMKERKLWN